MPSRFLFDEDSLDESLRHAIQRHNATSVEEALDVEYIDGSNPDCPPRGSPDTLVIQWAVEHERIIVSKDTNTLIGYHRAFVEEGNATPGLLILRRRFRVETILETLIGIAHYLSPDQYASCCNFIPP